MNKTMHKLKISFILFLGEALPRTKAHYLSLYSTLTKMIFHWIVNTKILTSNLAPR